MVYETDKIIYYRIKLIVKKIIVVKKKDFWGLFSTEKNVFNYTNMKLIPLKFCLNTKINNLQSVIRKIK